MSSTIFTPGSGNSGTGWETPDNIRFYDGATATYSIPDNSTSNPLTITFDLSSLPSGTVEGLQINIHCRSQSSGYVTFTTRFNDGETLSKATPKAPSATTNYTLGGPTDLWGETSMSTDRLKNPLAAWSVVASNAYIGSLIAYIEYITLTVYYTEGSTTQSSTPMLFSFVF